MIELGAAPRGFGLVAGTLRLGPAEFGAVGSGRGIRRRARLLLAALAQIDDLSHLTRPYAAARRPNKAAAKRG